MTCHDDECIPSMATSPADEPKPAVPILFDESDRLRALRALRLLDSGPSDFYDRVTRLVARAMDTPIALVSLVDANRQWFKSRIGIDAVETPREESFCAHAVLNGLPLIVRDATQDERFVNNPLVTGAPHIRAYIGVPLITRHGYAIGTLCAIDTRGPREFDANDLQQLNDYAKLIEESVHAQELASETDHVLRFATQNARLFHDTFNQAAVGITLVSTDGRLLRVNDCTCLILGYSAAELYGMSFVDITFPDDIEHTRAALRLMQAGNLQSQRVEKRFRCKHGGYVWTDLSFALKQGSAGESNYIIAVMVDISARKQAEAELLMARDSLHDQVKQQTYELVENNHKLELQIERVLESERLTRHAVNELEHFHYALDQFASVTVVDLDGTITHANKKFCELSGYSPVELVGQTHQIMKSEVHPTEVFGNLWQTIVSGTAWQGELCNRKKSGELYWVDALIVPYADEFGHVTKLVNMSIEITERKQSQELLAAEEKKSREINERLRQIADNVPAFIAYWDDKGICRFANKRAFDRFGLTPQQIVGMSFRDLYGLSFADRCPYVEAVMRGEGQQFEHSAVMADGSVTQCRSEYVPHWKDENVVGFYALIVDVTQQKQAEAELAQAQKLESIGQLSAGIAHEINTPTQFIGSNVGFLKDSVPEVFALVKLIETMSSSSSTGMIEAADLIRAMQSVDLNFIFAEVPKAIEQTLEGIERIQKIVGAMKEFSHPGVETTFLDLNRAINSTIVVASNEWKYVANLTTDFDAELPLIPVMPGSFNQVILNMIVNAAHAVTEAAEKTSAENRSKGTISISTKRLEQWVEIRIQDTGCGIPSNIRDRIFDPFFTTKPVGKGTGQGLAIAHDVIVKKHRGAISVESEVGVGSTFVIRLPLGEESVNEAVAA